MRQEFIKKGRFLRDFRGNLMFETDIIYGDSPITPLVAISDPSEAHFRAVYQRTVPVILPVSQRGIVLTISTCDNRNALLQPMDRNRVTHFPRNDCMIHRRQPINFPPHPYNLVNALLVLRVATLCNARSSLTNVRLSSIPRQPRAFRPFPLSRRMPLSLRRK